MSEKMDALAARVKEAAAQATGGSWRVITDMPALAIGVDNYRIVQTPNQNNCRHFGSSNRWDGIDSVANAEHIAAANPANILAILADRDALKAERSWRCFHCDEVFYTMDAARAHFGSSEIDEPACKVDGGLAAAFRDLESRWRQCLHEDCPAMRGAYSCDADHRQALKREEELGFNRGVADMRTENAALNARLAETLRERDEALAALATPPA